MTRVTWNDLTLLILHFQNHRQSDKDWRCCLIQCVGARIRSKDSDISPETENLLQFHSHDLPSFTWTGSDTDIKLHSEPETYTFTSRDD